jgi:hypothetical protein
MSEPSIFHRDIHSCTTELEAANASFNTAQQVNAEQDARRI